MTPSFSTQLIGQTEKTLNAILDRQLAGAVSEPQWVALILTAASGGSDDPDELAARVAGALKVDLATAKSHIERLAAKGLVEPADDADFALTLTATGQQLLDRVRAEVGKITQRLWGDLPPADLEVAGRVLSTVLERAEAELSARS
jgi:DNA-binding MarR family transcriptional regulator